MRVNWLISRIIYPITPEGAAFTNGYAGHGTNADIGPKDNFETASKQPGSLGRWRETGKGGGSIPGERVKALARLTCPSDKGE